MRILRTVILSIGLAAVATACGGKSKSEPTTTENTGGDTAGAMGGDAYGATTETPAEGEPAGGEMGGGGEDPCAGGE